MRRLLLAVILPVLFALGLAACNPPPPNVIIYGDSLSQEAASFANHFGDLSGKANIVNRTYGGTSPCTWFSQMQSDAANLHPEAVIFEFAGNAIDSCMNGYTATIPAIVAKFKVDTQTAINTFPGVKFYLTSLPPPEPPSQLEKFVDDSEVAQLNAMYQTFVGQKNVVWNAQAAQTVEASDGSWAYSGPCWEIDYQCGTAGPGMNRLRADDGFHFCFGSSAYGSNGFYDCSVYDSGALRYAVGELGPAQSDFGF